jgi:hypothetical protein
LAAVEEEIRPGLTHPPAYGVVEEMPGDHHDRDRRPSVPPPDRFHDRHPGELVVAPARIRRVD